MSERWRCFVAVPIPEQLRDSLRTAVDGWRGQSDLAGLRWTDADVWHVTLAFLGSIDASEVENVSSRISGVAAEHAPMRLRTGGLGAFPSAGRARVAWYGVHDADGALVALASDVRSALTLDDERPLRAHLTLARARREPVDLRSWLREASAPEGTLDVDRLQLMRSHLGRGPARYETLAAVPLEVPVHV